MVSKGLERAVNLGDAKNCFVRHISVSVRWS